MSKCSKCADALGEVKCNACLNYYCFDCAKLRELSHRKKSADEQAQWVCSGCRAVRGKLSPLPSGPEPIAQTAASVSNVADLIAELRNDFQKGQNLLNGKLNSVIESQSFLSAKYDELLGKLNFLDKFQEKVEKLEIMVTERDREIAELKTQVRLNEQYGRRRQLEIHGAIQQPNENLDQIVINIARQVNVNVTPSDIDAVHRLPSKIKQRPCPIIVELKSRRMRDEIIYNKRSRKIYDPAGKEVRIFESMSMYYKNLLWKTKQICQDKQFKFAWFKKNTIIVKKTLESKEVIYVRNEEDLKNIK